MGEEQIVQLLLLLLPSRMEIGSLEEKIGSRDQGSTRNNVVDFDFLFEFSPERRTESDLRFEQDQSQQGGSQSQTEGNRSRRSEVRPYPPPGCLIQKCDKLLFMIQIDLWISIRQSSESYSQKIFPPHCIIL